MRPGLALLFWVGAALAADSTGPQVEVEQLGRHYVATVRVPVQAGAARIAQVLSDYQGLARLHEVVLESRVLERGPELTRVRVVTRACVWLFCARMVQVMLYRPIHDGVLEATMEPETSDFDSGYMRWEIQPLGAHRARLTYHADLVPGFWVPPFVGPWLLKSRLARLASEVTEAIAERAAELERAEAAPAGLPVTERP